MARVNTTQAVEAWIKGKHHKKCDTIWTSGGILFSYNTPIGKWSDADGNTAILNMQRYSVTTSCQQNGVTQLLARSGKRMLLCGAASDFAITERE